MLWKICNFKDAYIFIIKKIRQRHWLTISYFVVYSESVCDILINWFWWTV